MARSCCHRDCEKRRNANDYRKVTLPYDEAKKISIHPIAVASEVKVVLCATCDVRRYEARKRQREVWQRHDIFFQDIFFVLFIVFEIHGLSYGMHNGRFEVHKPKLRTGAGGGYFVIACGALAVAVVTLVHHRRKRSASLFCIFFNAPRRTEERLQFF